MELAVARCVIIAALGASFNENGDQQYPPSPPPPTPPPDSPPPVPPPPSPPSPDVLWQAAEAGDARTVRVVLDEGGSGDGYSSGITDINYVFPRPGSEYVGVNARGETSYAGLNYGMTPLAIATSNGHEDVVAELIARNADVNARSPLVLAAAKGHTKILKRLLAAGALVNQPCGESAKACGGLEGAPTALHAGIQLLHPGVVEALLRAGADPTLTDIYGADAKKMAAEAAAKWALNWKLRDRMEEAGGGDSERVFKLLDSSLRDRRHPGETRRDRGT